MIRQPHPLIMSLVLHNFTKSYHVLIACLIWVLGDRYPRKDGKEQIRCPLVVLRQHTNLSMEVENGNNIQILEFQGSVHLRLSVVSSFICFFVSSLICCIFLQWLSIRLFMASFRVCYYIFTSQQLFGEKLSVKAPLGRGYSLNTHLNSKYQRAHPEMCVV